MGSPQPPGVTGHPNGVSSPPARLQTLSLSHFPISLLAIIKLSHAEGWCCVEVGPWEWLYPVPLPVPSFWGAGVSTLGPLGLGCRNGACPPSIGSAAWGPPDTSGGSSRRGTFTWKTACQHLPWPPSQDGGGGGAARGTGGNDVPWKTQAGGGRMPARSLPALCTGYRDGRKICNFPGNFLQSGSKMPGSDCKTAAADDPHSPRPRIPGRAPPTHPRVPVGSLAEPGPVLAAAGTAVAEPG